MDKQQIAQIVEQHRETCKNLGYAFFENGDYNLNFHAIRHDGIFDNQFSDKLRILYKDKGVWQVFEINWTTLAGTYGDGGAFDPLSGTRTGTGVSGVAVIVPTQYRSVYRFVNYYTGFSQYPYFYQIGNMQYWRDNDKNDKVNTAGKIYTGNYGTHLHRMSGNG